MHICISIDNAFKRKGCYLSYIVTYSERLKALFLLSVFGAVKIRHIITIVRIRHTTTIVKYITYNKEYKIMTEQGHRKPPRGYKNIDVALLSLKKLEGSVKGCNQETPAHTLSATRWLENAFVSKEIDEEYYDEFMERIKIQTRLFMNKCDCTSASHET